MTELANTSCTGNPLSRAASSLVDMLQNTPRRKDGAESTATSRFRSVGIGQEVLSELINAGLVEKIGSIEIENEGWNSPMGGISHTNSSLFNEAQHDMHTRADAMDGDFVFIRDSKQGGCAVVTLKATADVYRLKASSSVSVDLTNASMGARPASNDSNL